MKKVDDHRWVHFDPEMHVGQSCDDVDIADVEGNSHRIIVAAIRVEDIFAKIITTFIKGMADMSSKVARISVVPQCVGRILPNRLIIKA